MLPWKDTNPENEQVRFIERCQAGEVTFVDACRQFGISRKTGYKRLQRFRSLGWDGLGDRSRAPRSHPNETPGAIAERLIAAKQVLSDVGAEEGGGMAAKRRAAGVLAGAQHGGEHTGQSWTGETTETTTSCHTLE